MSTTRTVHPSLGILIDENPVLRPTAHGDEAGQEIGVIRLGRETDPYLAIQSTSVEAFLALADAAQEAARRLRARQAANGLRGALAS